LGERDESREATLRDYVRMVWRRKWVVIAATVVLTALAVAYSATRTPLYAATSRLMYVEQVDVSNPLSASGYVDPSQVQVELASVSSVIASPELVKSAADKIHDGGSLASYSVSAAPDDSTGQSGGNTVTVTAVSPSAEVSALAANAYAQAFIDWRRGQEQEAVQKAEKVVQDSLDSYTTKESRQTSDYFTLQQRLQDLKILEATATGNFRVLVPAVTPSQPFSPRTKRNAAMGLLGGLVLGTLIAVLLAQFDTRLRTVDEVAGVLGLPVLGRVHRLPAKKVEERPLYALSEAHDPAAEAVRKLRGNLEFAGVDGDLDSFFVTSCLQHEGKSLLVCNLALSLAATGGRIVLVDADLRRPQVHKYLGLRNAVGLSTVLTGRNTLRDALHVVPLAPTRVPPGMDGDAGVASNGRARLHVLTSGLLPPNPGEMIASKAFGALMQDLRASFDLVVVDAPALLAVGDTSSIAKVVGGVIFLVDLARAQRPYIAEAAGQLAQLPCRKLGVVVLTPPPGKHNRSAAYYYYSHTVPPLTAGAETPEARERAHS
jgi:polysaccharide biosynthesis transport protein